MVHSNQHEPNRFTPVVKAMELVDHVLTITDNINKFPDYTTKEKKNEDGTVTMVLVQRQDGLVNWAREQAMQIYLLAFTANEINLTKEPLRKEERLQKQEAAISLCGEHLALTQLCQKHFHLSHKKVKYWGDLTIGVRDSLKWWNNSDKDRYKNI